MLYILVIFQTLIFIYCCIFSIYLLILLIWSKGFTISPTVSSNKKSIKKIAEFLSDYIKEKECKNIQRKRGKASEFFENEWEYSFPFLYFFVKINKEEFSTAKRKFIPIVFLNLCKTLLKVWKTLIYRWRVSTIPQRGLWKTVVKSFF